MAERIQLGLVFGGRSGEHEVSLMSTRSVLNALDPDRYVITQIAITKEGRWFSGPHALTALETGNVNGLTPVVLRAEPGHAALYALDGAASPLASMDVIFPCCMAHTARMARSGALNWPMWLMSARVSWRRPSAWIRACQKGACAPTGCP